MLILRGTIMRKFYVGAALATALLASPAYAQTDAGRFGGGHIEVIGGIDFARAEVDEEEDEEGGSTSSKGGLYGIAGGFDFASGTGLVFGVEGEISESTTDFCEAGLCIDASRDLYVGGRVGTVVQDTALLYLKGGYTRARIELTASGDEDTEELDSTNLDGLRVGAGVEWNTGSPILVKVEYRYSNYESDFSRHQGLIGLGIRF